MVIQSGSPVSIVSGRGTLNRGARSGNNTVDTTLKAAFDGLAATVAPRVTQVFNFQPGSGQRVEIGSHALGTSSGWTACSVSPTGSVVGSFKLVSSGAQAMFSLDVSGFAPVAPIGQTFTAVGGVRTQWRLVVQRTGVSSLTIPVPRLPRDWQFPVDWTGMHTAGERFTYVASLGAGSYSVEVQALKVAGVSSQFMMDSQDRIVLLVQELTL